MALLILFGYQGLWYALPIGILLVASGSRRHCPLYQSLGLNTHRVKREFFLSKLPAHNPEPVFIFNNRGKLAFRNDSALKVLPALEDISKLLVKHSRSPEEIIGQRDNFFEYFDYEDRHYMVHFKGVADINSILAYAFNVTDLVRINDEIITTQKELVYRLGEIGETRSKETGYHVKRVAEYSRLLAVLAGTPEDEAELLKMASPMHDIGKIAIPDHILNKPGRLDEDEWVVMKTHAQIGHKLLSNSERPIFKAAAIVAQQHHEKWDGSGYPAGMAGESIHLYGRITAVADVFDALGSARVYKPAWPLQKILDLFQEERGNHFDPRLVDLFLAHLDRFLVIRDRYQDPAANQPAR